MDTTLLPSTSVLESTPLKKNNTSGSAPASKSAKTLVLNVSSDVADASFTLFPVSVSHAFTASWKFCAFPSFPAYVVVTFKDTDFFVSPCVVVPFASLLVPPPQADSDNANVKANTLDTILFISNSSLFHLTKNIVCHHNHANAFCRNDKKLP